MKRSTLLEGLIKSHHNTTQNLILIIFRTYLFWWSPTTYLICIQVCIHENISTVFFSHFFGSREKSTSLWQDWFFFHSPLSQFDWPTNFGDKHFFRQPGPLNWFTAALQKCLQLTSYRDDAHKGGLGCYSQNQCRVK